MPFSLYFAFNGSAWLKINKNFRFVPAVGAGELTRYFFVGMFCARNRCCLLRGIFFYRFKGTGDKHLSLIAALFTFAYLSKCFAGDLFCHLLGSPSLLQSFLAKVNDGKSANACQILITGI
jgi:hypothetical protein